MIAPLSHVLLLSSVSEAAAENQGFVRRPDEKAGEGTA